jgi:Xaa-Pro aminopeptidase
VIGTHQRVLCASSQAAAIAALKPGAPMSAAMEAATKSLEESPDAAIKALAGKLTKNVGFGMGLEFRDNTAMLDHTSDVVVKAGMVFNVMVGGTDPCSKETDSKPSRLKRTFLG